MPHFWNWWLLLCWGLLYHFQIKIYVNYRTSTATMHPENYSLGKHNWFQDLQRQNAMHAFLSNEKNAQQQFEDTEIPVVDEYKFLGVIFNKKLTFISHTKYLKTKFTRAQQLLWVVTHTEWGADQQMFLKLYRSLICSKLDYAIFIYVSVQRSYIKQLDLIHHEGLRKVLGAFSWQQIWQGPWSTPTTQM